MFHARVHRDVAAQRAALRRDHPDFRFVEDEPSIGDEAERQHAIERCCYGLTSMIRSGLRASTTDHPEQGIRKSQLTVRTAHAGWVQWERCSCGRIMCARCSSMRRFRLWGRAVSSAGCSIPSMHLLNPNLPLFRPY